MRNAVTSRREPLPSAPLGSRLRGNDGCLEVCHWGKRIEARIE